ncbi:MAG: hypothetical protein WCY36_05850 [Candidatus Omnitrophota bacterium]
MKIRLLIPIATTILLMVFLCATVCWTAQAAAQYVMAQEKKNALIQSVEENVDVLRACLPPYSRMSQGGAPLSIDPKTVSEIAESVRSEAN